MPTFPQPAASCHCLHCAGAGCTCGCQPSATAAAAPTIDRPACRCGADCACSAAGGVCRCGDVPTSR